MIAHVVILVLLIAAAFAGAVLANKRRTARGKPEPEFGAAMSFVGAAYGLLLGLLVSFAVGHTSNVRSEAQRESGSLLSLYDNLAAYPQPTRDHVRHTLVCYMRSIVNDDWPSMERGDQLEAPRTLAIGDRLRNDIRNLPDDTSQEKVAIGRAASMISDADASRQRLLFLTAPEIPAALWVVLYVGAFLVFFMLSVHYAAKPAGRTWALGGVAALMVVVFGVLGMLDQPFGVGVHVTPAQMRQTINLVLVDETSPIVHAPC